MAKGDNFEMKFLNHIFAKHKIPAASITVGVVALVVYFMASVFAATTYQPGETLDPAEGPGDASVAFPSSGWTDDGTNVRLTTNTDNVGIGTQTPSTRLDVAENNLTTSGAGVLQLRNIGTGSNNIETRILFNAGRSGNADALVGAIYAKPLTGPGTQSALVLQGATAGVLSDTLTVRGSNVGIGTASPTNPLTVAGNANFTGSITVASCTGCGGGSSQWTTSGSDIYYTTGKVGIGTTTPEFKLSLDSDGGILAKGTVGSGTTLTTTGLGTRMIWYPKKAAFRAGRAGISTWDDANIGDYSAAFGDGTTAAGSHSIVTGFTSSAAGAASQAFGYSAQALNSYSTAIGRTVTASADYAMAFGNLITVSGTRSVGFGLDGTSYTVSDPSVFSIMGGNVGIGDVSPTSLLTVGSGDLFQVNSSGNLVKLNNVTYSWPSSQGGSSTVLTNDGSGNLSWAAAGGGGGGITVGSTTITGGTSGAIPFNSAGVYGEDATKLFWDNANNRLGVGTSLPESSLHIGGPSTSYEYLQLDHEVNGISGPPPLADCDDALEAGRIATSDIVSPSTGIRVYICSPSGGWLVLFSEF